MLRLVSLFIAMLSLSRALTVHKALARVGALRAAVTTSTSGAPGTTEYRVFFQDGGKTISPWHDIPLRAAGEYFNFVCEIPK